VEGVVAGGEGKAERDEVGEGDGAEM